MAHMPANLITNRTARLPGDLKLPPVATECRPHWTQFARGGAKHVRGVMNKTESKYSDHLEVRKVLGAVAWFAFEGVTFRLGKGVRYTPDFLVMLSNGELQCHEVKGFWAEAARVRIKVAAELFPFRFLAFKPRARKNGGGWAVEEF